MSHELLRTPTSALPPGRQDYFPSSDRKGLKQGSRSGVCVWGGVISVFSSLSTPPPSHFSAVCPSLLVSAFPDSVHT